MSDKPSDKPPLTVEEVLGYADFETRDPDQYTHIEDEADRALEALADFFKRQHVKTCGRSVVTR